MTDKHNVAAELRWRWGSASVERLAGRLAELTVLLPNGQSCAPFAPPAWLDEDPGSVAPLLRRLRGEWPCVPFGFDLDRPATGDWPATQATDAIDTGHGFSSSSDWHVEKASAASADLSLDYPNDHPIARLERRIAADPTSPALDFTLTVHPRRNCRLPIGLHPMFRLPDEPGALEIELDTSTEVMTFPGAPAPSSNFLPDQRTNIGSIALRDGTRVDGRAVPLARRSVELVQVLRASGRIALANRREGYRLRLTWNAEHFPSVLLWYSNRGNDDPPWNGRHLALGVEPICAAFDLGVGTSSGANPINALGIPTAIAFEAGVPFTTRYRLEVAPL